MGELLDRAQKLPFDRKMQQAVFGHMLHNSKFFVRASLKIRPEWFTEDILIGKLYRLAKQHSETYRRHPTAAELLNHPEIRAEPLKTQAEYKERLAQAKQAKDEISLPFIQAQLSDWLVAMTYRSAIEKSTDAYNRGQFDRVADIFQTVYKKAADLKFDDLPAVDFANYDSLFEHIEFERDNALSFGCQSIDAALLDGATKQSGGLLRGDTTLLIAPSNVGKCHGIDTPIMMADGTIKMVQDIKTGDQVMGPDGKPRNVLGTTRGRGPLYKIIPKSGGESWVCNDVHVLSLRPGKEEYRYRKSDIHNIPLNEYLTKSKNYKKIMRLWRVGLEFDHKELPLDPYLFGLWLGDGSEHCAPLTSADKRIQNDWSGWIDSMGDGAKRGKSNALLREMGVLDNKHIPHDYLTSSRAQRLELLAGIIDSDGCRENSTMTVCQKRRRLIDDVAFLARSLGFEVTVTNTIKKDQNGTPGTYYLAVVRGKVSEIPSRLGRKQSKDQKRNPLISGFRVEPLGEGDYYGFELDGDHLYLLGDFTVTHNTSACITTICENLRRQKSVLFLTHEGRWEDIVAKIWQNLLRVTQRELVTLRKNPQGRKRLDFVMKYLTRNLVYLPYNKPGQTVEDVFPLLLRAQEERIAKVGKGFDLIVDDYPAKLYTRRAERHPLPRREIDRVVYDHFVQFAHDNNCHCLVPIQTNRAGSKVNNGADGRVLLKEDVSEAWGPVEMVANIITMTRPPRGKEEGWVEFFVDKSRSNQTGTIVLCRTRYDWCTTHADDLGSVWWQGVDTCEERALQFLNGFSNDQKGKHNPVPDALVK